MLNFRRGPCSSSSSSWRRHNLLFHRMNGLMQAWVVAVDIRIVLNRINTFRDEVFGDPNVLRSYFYAISDLAVGGRWVACFNIIIIIIIIIIIKLFIQSESCVSSYAVARKENESVTLNSWHWIGDTVVGTSGQWPRKLDKTFSIASATEDWRLHGCHDFWMRRTHATIVRWMLV